MKKALLLMAAGSFTLAANAQMLNRSSVLFNQNGQSVSKPQAQRNNIKSGEEAFKDLTKKTGRSVERTTTGGGRWYSYGSNFLTFAGSNVNESLATMWNDTSAMYNYGTEGINYSTSCGTSFDPTWACYYDASYYATGALTGSIEISSTNSYYIDSVVLYGSYTRPSTAVNKDTITLGLVYGGTSSTDNLSDYSYYQGAAGSWPSTSYPGYDTLKFLSMTHDSLHNVAGQRSGSTTPVYVQKVQVGDADTSSNFAMVVPVGTGAGFMVPPGGLVAMSVSFHNGDHPDMFNPPAPVQDASGQYYSYYEPLVIGNGDGAGNSIMPVYATNAGSGYLPTNWYGTGVDWNVGYWKYGGSYNQGATNYYPMWVFGDPSAPTWQQYFAYDFHVTCPTCWTLGVDDVNKNQLSGVKAYPNPANEVMNVSYEFAKATTATISLTNMLGQTVLSQTINNAGYGAAKLNTTAVPAGIYLLTIESNDGYKQSGRVNIAH